MSATPFLTCAVLSAGTLDQRPQPTLPAGDSLLLRPWRTVMSPHGPKGPGAVTDADTDRLLRRSALRSIVLADGCAELAYWTAPLARGQGVAPRATTILTLRALVEIGVHCLDSSTPSATRGPARWPRKPASLWRAPSAVPFFIRTAGTTHLHARAGRLTLRARTELFRSLAQLGRRSDPDRRRGARPDRATVQK